MLKALLVCLVLKLEYAIVNQTTYLEKNAQNHVCMNIEYHLSSELKVKLGNKYFQQALSFEMGVNVILI